MKKYLPAVVAALLLSTVAANAVIYRAPKKFCDGKVEVSRIDIKVVTRNYDSSFSYTALLTNIGQGPVTYTAKLSGWKSSVKVVLPLNETNTMAAGAGKYLTLGYTSLANGNDPGLNQEELERALTVTCK